MPNIVTTKILTGHPSQVIDKLKKYISRTVNNDRVQCFYIGRTIDLERRAAQHERDKGLFDKMIALYITSSTRYIVQVEQDLIGFYYYHEKSINITNGGPGMLNQDYHQYIYIITWK